MLKHASHPFRLPKKFVICRCGLLTVILAHALLLVGELLPPGETHHHCKLAGYGALLVVLTYRAVKLTLNGGRAPSKTPYPQWLNFTPPRDDLIHG